MTSATTIKDLLRSRANQRTSPAAVQIAKALREEEATPETLADVVLTCLGQLTQRGYENDLAEGTATPLQELVEAAWQYWFTLHPSTQDLLGVQFRQEMKDLEDPQRQLRYSCARVGYFAAMLAPPRPEPPTDGSAN